MPITKDYEFVCPSCREPFQFFLSEQTKLASFENVWRKMLGIIIYPLLQSVKTVVI